MKKALIKMKEERKRDRERWRKASCSGN